MSKNSHFLNKNIILSKKNVLNKNEKRDPSVNRGIAFFIFHYQLSIIH